jgi:hypothetical protein
MSRGTYPCLLRGNLLVRSTVGSHRIASSLELSRTAPPSRASPLYLLLQRQQKATEARAHTLPPVTSARCAFEDADEARRQRSLTGALRLCRPPPLPPFRPASSLSGDRPSGALVRWRVAGGCAVCLRCGVVVWKCCSDAARVVQDARVLRDEMR